MKRHFLILALALGLTASVQAQITAPAEKTQTETADPNAKYLVPIPEEDDGMVYLVRELTLPAGTNADETFAKMKDWVNRCMQDKRILSSTELEADQPYTLRQLVRQDMVFSAGLLATDKAEISYVLDFALSGDKLILKLRRISYRYNGDNPDRKMLRCSAEDYISDRVALNKKKDKMIFGYRKFRTKTIDLIDEYEASLKMAFWIK